MEFENFFEDKVRIFYLGTLLNFLIFQSYHDLFFYNIPSQINLIFSFFVNFNYFFGYAFIPYLFLNTYFLMKEEYKKSLLSFFLMLGCDLFFTYFEKSGAFGIVIKYKFLNNFAPILGILTNALSLFLIYYKKKEKEIKFVQKKINEVLHILPPLSILTIGEKIKLKTNFEEQQESLKKVLKDFGIDAKIIEIIPGPVVTLYSIELAPGIKSSRVINLSDDIARSMETFSTRISTIPGKNLLGIEISNEKRQIVYFKEGLITPKYQNFAGNLPLYLGCNIYGEHEVFDLSTMPHLLVAGTTGSGKSVGIHTMLLSLLFKKRFDELKLILIDPKQLELTPYQQIPHLILPVVTQAKQAIQAVKWAVKEMDARFKNMSSMGVRHITTFNEKVEKTKESEKYPFIVIVIDEMADLMLVAGKEFELYVQRLAQMGRAAGIHIIMATQRPSVNVITGTIKANFPTRISFRLSSKIDSRTILGDVSGAEQLLGSGDMLYLGNNGQIKRVHGSFVSEADVLETVNFWKEQAKPEYIVLKEEDDEEPGFERQDDGIEDEYYNQAVELIKLEKKVSTSFLQRNFPIGYNRAAKIIEKMEKEGIISKGDKFGRNREIF